MTGGGVVALVARRVSPHDQVPLCLLSFTLWCPQDLNLLPRRLTQGLTPAYKPWYIFVNSPGKLLLIL